MTIENLRRSASRRAAPARPKSQAGRLEDRVKDHPDFAKWEAIASEVEFENPEDALAEEHRDTSNEEKLSIEARLYWLRRGIGEDAQGFSQVGEHLKKPQELAKVFGVEVSVATDILTDTHAEVEAWLAEQARKTNFDGMKRSAEREIDRLEMRLSQLAA